MHNFVFNLAGREVQGYDLEVAYNQSLAQYGDVRFKLLFNTVNKHQTQAQPDAPWIDELDQLPYFKQRANFATTYRYQELMLNWTVVYQGSIYDDKDADYFNNHISAHVVHNAQLRYTFSDGLVEVYFGADNVFDQDPPFLPEGYASGVAQTATATPYSRIGRMWYLGTKVSF